MKRILSLIISVSLILSLFAFMPVSVSADESNITWIEVDQDYYDKNIKDKTFRNSYANTLAPQVNTAGEMVWYFKLTEDIVTDKGIQYVGRTGETKTGLSKTGFSRLGVSDAGEMGSSLSGSACTGFSGLGGSSSGAGMTGFSRMVYSTSASLPNSSLSRLRWTYPAFSSSFTVAQMLSTPSLQIRARPLVV